MRIVVTGGAGYIGSHVTRLLIQSGHEVLVLDDLSAGLEERVAGARLETLDLGEPGAAVALRSLLRDFGAEGVIHLAARKQVGESVAKPEWYYLQNVSGLANLLLAMREEGVSRLVFSSSAATYGMPDVELVSEELICQPINPYGETKLVGEWLVADAARAWGLRGVNLRYFNVAGAGWPDLADTAVQNLIPIAFAAIRAGESPKVFGSDYPTPDGTCIRDYVHVLDLAQAHIAALEYLERDERAHATFNVGTGVGSSVLEVLGAIERHIGRPVKPELAARRPGDPPRLCADVTRIERTLGWRASHDLTDMVASAWDATAKA